jgi:hypothetical protein
MLGWIKSYIGPEQFQSAFHDKDNSDQTVLHTSARTQLTWIKSQLPFDQYQSLLSQADQTGQTPIHLALLKKLHYSGGGYLSIDSEAYEKNKHLFKELTAEQLKKVLTIPFGDKTINRNQTLIDKLAGSLDSETLNLIVDRTGPEIFLDSDGRVSNASPLVQLIENSKVETTQALFSRIRKSDQKRILNEALSTQNYSGKTLLQRLESSYLGKPTFDWIKTQLSSH